MDNEILELTKKIVKLDTSKTSIEAAYLLVEFFKNHGLEPIIYEYDEGQVNVEVRIGPKAGQKILISGHLDVVPAGDPSKWEHDPFLGEIVDGYLWGRGSVDMKAGTAMLAGLMIELKDKELKHEIIYVATSQEEVGLLGAQNYVKNGIDGKISHIIIAEPTDLQALVMEKGILWYEIKAFGKQAHASRPDLGVNAIEGLTKLFPELYTVIPDVEVPDLGKTTLNIAVIEGGVAANMIPETAKVLCDMRLTPGVTIKEIEDGIKQIVENNTTTELKFEYSRIEGSEAVKSANNSFAKKLRDLTKKYYGKDYQLSGAFYATDGAIFMELGDPDYTQFVIYGPGSTKLLHQTNEKLDLNQLNISRKVLYEAILSISA
jgi:succinyl-diaminopimelate desuccinylase